MYESSFELTDSTGEASFSVKFLVQDVKEMTPTGLCLAIFEEVRRTFPPELLGKD